MFRDMIGLQIGDTQMQNPRNKLAIAAAMGAVVIVAVTLAQSPASGDLFQSADPNRDGQISKEEIATYARQVLKDIQVRLDEKSLTLSLVDVSFPALKEIEGGLGVIRIKATAPVGPLDAGSHRLHLTNTHLPAISVYLVNALVPKNAAIKITKQSRDELQKSYRLDFDVALPTLQR